MKPKVSRLIVACDGTWLSAGTGNHLEITNVTNFCRALQSTGRTKSNKTKAQIVYYQSGVGSSVGGLQHLIAGSTGTGLEDNVREAYVFLSDNYDIGDEIFLFGFSRGAYTARSIASLIGSIGILTAHGMQYFSAIYGLYKSAKSVADWKKSFAAYIKKNDLDSTDWRVAPEKIIIKVVGCWETVGALGVPKTSISDLLHLNDKYQFLDTQLPPRVENAFHAVALDEHRSSFYPTIWWLDPHAQAITDRKGKIVQPMLIQCWFPGHHNELGGQAPGRKISNLALAWLVDQCMSRKLLNFDMEFLKEYVASTRNKPEPNWMANQDPFYGGILPSAMWTILGSRVRKPGREPIPKGWSPPTEGSKTFEYIHYSLREKIDEMVTSKLYSCEECGILEVPTPSRALKGYEYSPKHKGWVFKFDGLVVPGRTLKEYPPPSSDDKESLQAWISSDWLRKWEEQEDAQMTKLQAVRK